MSPKNVVIHCRVALQDGRNSKSITKQVQIDTDVLANFRGPAKEDAFAAWVAANYPGYIYADYSGSIKMPDDIDIKTKNSKNSNKKRQQKGKDKNKPKESFLITLILLPFRIVLFLLKLIWKFLKWNNR